MQILLFEDDAGSGLLTKEALRGAGHEVDLVRRGADGLILAGKKKYDVYLLDQMMGDMTGLEIFEQIQKTNPDALAIMVTGSGDERIAVTAMKMGVADYIIKSPDLAHLTTLPLVIDMAREQRKLAVESEQMIRELREQNLKIKEQLKKLEICEQVSKAREKRIQELEAELKSLKTKTK